MIGLVLANLLLAFVWAAVTGSFSGLNLMFGAVLGAAALYLLREQLGTKGYFGRLWAVLVLSATFLKELVLSAVRVAVLVLRPGKTLCPGIIAFPLSVKSDVEIALLANLITLTPGTLSIDVSEDRSTLYIHCVDVDDPEAVRRDIADTFERQIAEVFQ